MVVETIQLRAAGQKIKIKKIKGFGFLNIFKNMKIILTPKKNQELEPKALKIGQH